MEKLRSLVLRLANTFLYGSHWDKLKRLFIYVLKHPIKSIFWVIKAYFVLLFWLLLLAFLLSRCAEASTSEICRVGTPLSGVGCVVPAKLLDGEYTASFEFYSNRFTGKGASQNEAINNAIRSMQARFNSTSETSNTTCKIVYKTQVTASPQQRNSIFYVVGNMISSQTRTGLNGYTCDPPPNPSDSPFEIVVSLSFSNDKKYACPNDAYPSFLTYRQSGQLHYCVKGFDGMCFVGQPDSMPDFYFPPNKTTSQTLCVPADDPNLKCPYKFKDTFPSGQRVYVPDYDNNRACEDGTKPNEPKPEPPQNECKPVGTQGLKVCPADPNQKCKADPTGQIRCEKNCGYYGGKFVCFAEPEKPKDPNRPDGDPLVDPDDTVDNPDKKMPDITKQDLKDSHKGVEGRLDNILKQLQANGEGQQYDLSGTNSLLRSIDGTLTDLKNGLSDNGQGTVPTAPDNDRKKNNWETKNFQTVLEKHMNTLKNNPTFSAVRTFFNVRNFGGTCPTYSINAWVFEISIDQLCSSQFLSVMPVIKAIVILMFTWFGFRIAFL